MKHFVALALFFATTAALATEYSREVWLPMPSPAASVQQTLGVTEVQVEYARPAVKGRQVWGSLVPWGEVWRTGADLNTRISVSTEVRFGGAALPAGTYGLHTIPREQGPWTVILSRDADGWGSYAYGEGRDVLRVEVTPRAAEHVEDLRFSFEALTADSMVLSLRWEKLEIPVEIGIDRKATVLADLERQLTGLPQFYPTSWSDAARFAIEVGDLPRAETWVERSLGVEETFAGLVVRSELRAAQGKSAEAATDRERALALGNPSDLHQFGRRLLDSGDTAGALAVFRTNVARHPESWLAPVGLARGLAVSGDKAEATKVLRRAIEMAPEASREQLRQLGARLELGPLD
jgi:hypothetical protein